MFYWSLAFFVLALVAGVLGFGGLAVVATDAARVLCGLFLGLFLATLAARHRPRRPRWPHHPGSW